MEQTPQSGLSGVAIPPLPPEPEARLLAPPPQIDKYPIIIGQNLTGQAVSSAYRLGITGWRYQFVDVINELLEQDPGTRGVLRQRLLGVSCGREQIDAPQLPESMAAEQDLAKRIRDHWAWEYEGIPFKTQALGQLDWAVVYGVSGAEIQWDKQDTWRIVGLSNIHSRRLNYPDPFSWDLHIYDQGLVGPGMTMMPTQGTFRLRVRDYPGKFITHTPALNADYPTRDGEARYIGVYMLLKRIIVRATAQDFERVIRPWLIGYFKRPPQQGEQVAGEKDIAALEQVVNKLGMGVLNAATLPDACKVEILRAAATMQVGEFLSFLNREIAKSLLGQAFTTEPGPNGNLATAEVADRNTLKILQYDAKCRCETVERYMVAPWMALNYPSVDPRLAPKHTIHVEELPSAKDVIEVAAKAHSMGLPMDRDDLGQRVGVKLTDDESKQVKPKQAAPAQPPTGKPSASPEQNQDGASGAKDEV